MAQVEHEDSRGGMVEGAVVVDVLVVVVGVVVLVSGLSPVNIQKLHGLVHLCKGHSEVLR